MNYHVRSSRLDCAIRRLSKSDKSKIETRIQRVRTLEDGRTLGRTVSFSSQPDLCASCNWIQNMSAYPTQDTGQQAYQLRRPQDLARCIRVVGMSVIEDRCRLGESPEDVYSLGLRVREIQSLDALPISTLNRRSCLGLTSTVCSLGW
jgi:hypothetical protein